MYWLRAVLAAGLSILFPGAGHVLLRDWLRAVLFATLFVTATIVFVPTGDVVASEPILEQAEALAGEMPTHVNLLLTVVVVISAVDAFLRGIRRPAARAVEGPSCPRCGRTLDDELSFCHWCTARLDRPSERGRAEG